MRKRVIAGTGCALADFVYNGLSFSDEKFSRYISVDAGDGGLSPGKLVFTEELESFAGQPYPEILRTITGGDHSGVFNVGGPSIVSLIHAAQMLGSDHYTVKFFGMAGVDATAGRIFDIVSRTPLDISNYLRTDSASTPFTDVFSDPGYDGGHGERTFVNNIGAACHFTPEMLTDEFFSADITCFGGTALVPQIHDSLESLLEKASSRGSVTVVNTVFDFRNEKLNPRRPWPLGRSREALRLMDILIMDAEESLKISGTKDQENAVRYFIDHNTPSFIITNGQNDMIAYSSGNGIFAPMPVIHMPVCSRIVRELKENPALKGDTTGCGDNFAGGVVTSIALQLQTLPKGSLDLAQAMALGAASGGFACYYLGGTYLEDRPFAKRDKVLAYCDNDNRSDAL